MFTRSTSWKGRTRSLGRDQPCTPGSCRAALHRTQRQMRSGRQHWRKGEHPAPDGRGTTAVGEARAGEHALAVPEEGLPAGARARAQSSAKAALVGSARPRTPSPSRVRGSRSLLSVAASLPALRLKLPSSSPRHPAAGALCRASTRAPEPCRCPGVLAGTPELQKSQQRLECGTAAVCSVLGKPVMPFAA